MRVVEDLEERVFDRAENLLAQRAFDVRKGVKDERRRVVGVLDGLCFGASRAGRDDGPCAGIERGDNSCGQEGGIDGGGEGGAQVAEVVADKVGSDGRGIGLKEIVHPLQRGVWLLAVDQRDVRVVEALDKLVDGGGRHGGGLTN